MKTRYRTQNVLKNGWEKVDGGRLKIWTFPPAVTITYTRQRGCLAGPASTGTLGLHAAMRRWGPLIRRTLLSTLSKPFHFDHCPSPFLLHRISIKPGFSSNDSSTTVPHSSALCTSSLPPIMPHWRHKWQSPISASPANLASSGHTIPAILVSNFAPFSLLSEMI